MKAIKKVIIPAAGFGTRLLPATKSQPKEMLPIVDKPTIQYLVEEAVASGIEEIIIITSKDKQSIEDYFDRSAALHSHLAHKKKKTLLKEIEKIEKLAKFFYVRQPSQKGDGDAILQAYSLIEEDEPVAVLFGDDIYDSKIPPLKQMIKVFNQKQTPIIALQKIPKSQSEKYGIAALNKNMEVQKLVEKPKPAKAPSNMAITGKYILTPDLLKTLANSRPTHPDGEHRLIDGMVEYIKEKPIHGCEIKGERFDVGDKLGYLKANIHFGLNDPNLKSDLKKYLRSIKF